MGVRAHIRKRSWGQQGWLFSQGRCAPDFAPENTTTAGWALARGRGESWAGKEARPGPSGPPEYLPGHYPDWGNLMKLHKVVLVSHLSVISACKWPMKNRKGRVMTFRVGRLE